MSKINCALIGFGRWGKIIYSKIAKNKKLNLIYICKKNKLKNNPDKLKIITNYKNTINNNVSMVFICTTAIYHYKIAKYALENKKAVFLEKPACLKNSDYKNLLNTAHTNNSLLHINYIHLYNENLIHFKKYYKRTKNNKKINVKLMIGNHELQNFNISPIMDWGPHIFSILEYLFGKLNIENAKIKKIINLNNKKKFNTYLKIKSKNKTIKVLFGNNFKSRTTRLEIIGDKFILQYNDNEMTFKKDGKKYMKNFQKKDPLTSSIDTFIANYINKNIYSKKNFCNTIYEKLEKLENKT